LILTVIMFLISGGFKGMDGMEMAESAIVCLLWEIGLMAVCCIAINVLLIIRFDRKGRLRSENRARKKEKKQEKAEDEKDEIV